MRLSNIANSRENNFNLIRMLAAYAVLVTHSFAVVTGASASEPFQNTLGMTIGTIAVDVFFLTSGFLVTISLFKRQSTVEFIWARFLRIFPALFIMHVVMIIGLGIFFTTMPLASYFHDDKIYFYILKCFIFFTGSYYELPGVFNNNPFKDSINNSLWTIPYELLMYATLVIFWFFYRSKLIDYRRAMEITVICIALFSGILLFSSQLNLIVGNSFIRFFFMFFMGASFFVVKDKIVFSKLMFYTFLTAMLISIADKRLFFYVYVLTLPYVLFYFSYVPAGIIRNYNRLGDYSYGMYIYAFPVQQSVVALKPDISIFNMIIISSVVTLFIAMLSWHLLEKRALKLKEFYVNRTRKVMY